MNSVQGRRRAGFLFLAGGLAFVAAAFLARQVAFAGVAAAFFGVGAVSLTRSRIEPR